MCAQAKAIYNAEVTCAKALGSLAKAMKDVPAAEYKLSVKGRLIEVSNAPLTTSNHLNIHT